MFLVCLDLQHVCGLMRRPDEHIRRSWVTSMRAYLGETERIGACYYVVMHAYLFGEAFG